VAELEYKVLLEGVSALDLPLSVLGALCDLLVEGAQRCARLLGEGRSVAQGTVPGWVSSAADLRASRFDEGSLDLGVRARPLLDVAPDIFAQQNLFRPVTDRDATAVDLFLEAAEDASTGKRDSDRFDPGVLELLSRVGTVFSRGGTSLTIGRADGKQIVIDAGAAARMKALADETPTARVARVRGTLDSLTVSTKALVLKLEDGGALRGRAGAIAIERLKELLGGLVVLEGAVAFRPNGEALRIEVESAWSAGAGDVIFAQLPRVEASSVKVRGAASATGLDALFGKWPGDETDAQLATALKETS
jgi:hypothetical protein